MSRPEDRGENMLLISKRIRILSMLQDFEKELYAKVDEPERDIKIMLVEAVKERVDSSPDELEEETATRIRFHILLWLGCERKEITPSDLVYFHTSYIYFNSCKLKG